MKWIMSTLLVMLISCTLNEFYQPVVQKKPINGYNRNLLFENYTITDIKNNKLVGYLGEQMVNRNVWNAENKNFRNMYPSFRIDLITFNQLPNARSFSWQERLLFSDALELVTFAINHPIFLREMRKSIFYDNSRTIIISSDVIVRKIREAQLQIILGKTTLEYNVLAEATIGALNSTIWFRDDTNYQKESVVFLAIVLAHELMHNLGYRHTSNVPYGIHEPINNVLLNAGIEDSLNFVKYTPFFEDDFLYRVRDINGAHVYRTDSDVEKDYKHNFKFIE